MIHSSALHVSEVILHESRHLYQYECVYSNISHCHSENTITKWNFEFENYVLYSLESLPRHLIQAIEKDAYKFAATTLSRFTFTGKQKKKNKPEAYSSNSF
ncbi:hypothetical protein KHQ82_08770 [Mycoplasmatota bacterium]|nr:hypothetical protein KHQ82_08770 [Mycoplasmatota bacterium]